MDDDRLIRQLRLVDVPASPRQAFREDLHALLAAELLFTSSPGGPLSPRDRARPRRGRAALLVLVAATLLGLASVGLVVVGRPSVAPPTPTSPVNTQSAPPSSAAPTRSPQPSATVRASPSLQALRGKGLVVVEHMTWTTLTRLESLAMDGSGNELLPDLPGIQERPAWTADGTRLAFAGYDPAATRQEAIWEWDAGRATARRITTDCTPPACLGEHDPAYSADGRSLVFVRSNGPAINGSPARWVVAILDLATGSVVELKPTRTDAAAARIRDPEWSPDGSRIVFSSTLFDAAGGAFGSTISIVNADGSGLRQLIPTELAGGEPTWSPDGSLILFSSRPIHSFSMAGQSGMHLYTSRPDGSDVQQLGAEGPVGAASWSADGSQILYTLATGYSPTGAAGLGAIRPILMVMDRDGTNVHSVVDQRPCCSWYAVQQPTP